VREVLPDDIKPTMVVMLHWRLVERCLREIDATFPRESGGVLMGRQRGQREICIDEIVGPGPNARHERYSFEPDLEWQRARIAERYARTGGKSTYLGDWHSHPEAGHGGLSNTDRTALKTIIRAPEAQCPKPLMMIFWGAPDAWSLSAWQARLRQRRVFGARLEVLPLEVHSAQRSTESYFSVDMPRG